MEKNKKVHRYKNKSKYLSLQISVSGMIFYSNPRK